MIITTIPDFSLQHDAHLALLRVEWIAGEDMRTFRTSAEQLLSLIQRLQVRHILLDMNSVPDISVYDQVWLGARWTPRMLSTSLERMVLVISRWRVHNQLAVDSLIALSRPYIKFDIQFFSVVVPGLHWLSDYSNRLPALLAEWDAMHGRDFPRTSGMPEPRAFYRPSL
ncbi:hypothetical protein IC235_15215 [Hymenobacter sp. BT664]|uniref:STAS/SEC14 domain-containing protein n=1 Tax=Hymenobacter montanus TaxID=2771359 RepID=A0A927GK95_9BACT|nr:hypothetical protein [Hymenobacter montanus]MBD2769240.1 hypothetical protein [Hymenobacter montanus]